MYGTDIDDTNYQHAVHNVSINEWDDRIKLFHTTADGPLIPLKTMRIKRLNFTMCNPPFFATKVEALATFAKDQQPFAACTGADVEMITPGGEVAYVRRMIEESVKLQDSVQWCTVQLGKMSSLHALMPMLKDEFGCTNWVVSVLQPSGQTVRWVLGWSWMPHRAPDEVARHKSLIGTGLQMEPNEISLVEALRDDPRSIILTTLKALPLQIHISHDDDRNHKKENGAPTLSVHTNSAVWSRSARRKRQREQSEDLDVPKQIETPCIFAHTFLITISRNSKEEDTDPGFSVRVRWAKGEDRAVFESFCGMLRAKIRSDGQ
jgi:23S rRNA (adenine1618-N6)-methyltransferase